MQWKSTRATAALLCCLVAVSSCGGGSSGDSQRTTTPPPNQAPTADAGLEQVVLEGAAVTLSGSQSTDADGSINAYSWTQTGGPSVVLDGAQSANASFDAPATDTPIELSFELRVTDNDGAADTAVVTVTVNPLPNLAPVANAGADQEVLEGDSVTLDGSDSADSDGLISAYSWTQVDGPAADLQGAGSAMPTFDAPLTDTLYVLNFELSVTDGAGAMDTSIVSVTVNPSQFPTADAGPDGEVVEGDSVTITGTGTDVDGSIASYLWTQTAGPAILPITNADTAEINFIAPDVAAPTDVILELTVTDHTQDSATDSVTITVHPNNPPEVSIHFPCTGCRQYGDLLSVTGSVNTGADDPFVSSTDEIVNLTVTIAGTTVDASLQADGKWLAQNVPVANGEDVFIVVNAEDRFGGTTEATRILIKAPTLASALIALNPVNVGSFYFYETNAQRERLFRLDSMSGPLATLRDVVPPGAADPDQVGDFVVDPTGNTAFVNVLGGRIDAIDLTGGTRSTLTGPGTGSGPDLVFPRLMDIDPGNGRLLVFDDGLRAVVAVDTISGARTLLSDEASIGAGPDFADPTHMAVDSTGGTLFLTRSAAELLSVDLQAGTRAVLTLTGAVASASGPLAWNSDGQYVLAFNNFDQLLAIDPLTGVIDVLSDGDADPELRTVRPRQVLYDQVSGRILVNDFSADTLTASGDRMIEYNPVSDARFHIFEDSVGTGPSLRGGGTLALDSSNEILYAAGREELLAIDIQSGNRTLISGGLTGTGTPLDTVRDVIWDASSNRVLVIDSATNLLLAVDPATGNRTIVSGGITGSGPAFDSPVAITLDQGNDRVFVANQGAGEVLAVDLLNGDRTLVSDNSNSGPTLIESGGIEYDAMAGRLFKTENGSGATSESGLLEIDIGSGDRIPISGFDVGTGPNMNSVRDLASLESSGQAVVAGDSGQIFLVNLDTGSRLLLADRIVGGGESFRNSASIAYDPERDVVYTWSANKAAILQFDLFTGSRVVLSK